ncbi:hypothetical protein [Nitrosovibrio tenuis]|uniref:Uncharacterized protein family (UPF0231) n=1 Tax=Nitrosovibrio tenuis TaxID=1233 RepID=A0A1H7K6D2_9PROT|nr:hypothetical protein [Nitrosovibrio tenuis]SEK81497.1 Uncharacterised protein family (UPF0231) [Nitrosovibrio tenuis]
MNATSFTWPGRRHDNPAHDLIAAYLAIDIQKNPNWANELLQKTREVKSGQISSWERIGNAYWLRLFPDHVEIEEDYAEEPGEAAIISIDDFEAAATAWREFVGQEA